MYSQQWQPYSPAPYAQPDYAQPDYAQPDYWRQGYGRPDSPAAITVTMRYFPLAFLLELVKPVLVIDGQPVPVSWRHPVTVPVAPGQHHVHAHTPYLLPRRMGKADLVVTAHPGQNVDLEYRAPLVVFAGGALGSGPQKYPGMVAFILLMVFTTLLAFCGAAAPLLGLSSLTAAQRITPSPTGPDIPALPPLSTKGPGLPTDPPTESAGKPSLRAGVPARKIAGATFGANARTATASFAGFPFAFRTPASWGCARETEAPAPDAKLWICRDPQNTGSVELVAVMLRPCAAPCGPAVQSALHQSWFRPDEKPRRAGASARFVEIPKGDTGRYELYLSHLFATDGGDTPQWQVGVAATAPPKERSDVQRVLNDVFSQTS